MNEQRSDFSLQLVPGVQKLRVYLHGKPPAVDAVLRTFGAVAWAPVELNLFCLEPAWQPPTTDEVIIL